MKNLIWGTIFILLLSVVSLATPVTISPASIPNWQYKGTTARIRIFSNQKFITSDASLIMQSLPTSNAWYKEINATVSGNTLYIPETVLDSTTDSSNAAATYIAYIYDYNNVRRDTWLSNFRVPHDLGSPITWTQILTYNQNAANPPPPGYYTNSQVNTLIAAALSNSVQANNSRLEKDQSLYSNSLANAVSALCPSSTCGTPTILNITRPITVGANLTVPKGLTINVTGEGKITLAAGVTLTINNFIDPGNRRVFDSSALNAKVYFPKGTIDAFKIAWISGTGDGIDITDAINEAVNYTVTNGGGKILFPEGRYTTTGGHVLSDATTIEGVGNFVLNGYGGTSLKLVSPTASFMFKIGEGEYGIRFKDILLDGTGTTGKYGLLLEGTYPNSSGDLKITNVVFSSFDRGLFYNDVEVGPNVNWQFAQITIEQSIFQFNEVGIYTTSLNSSFALKSVNFQVGSGKTAIYTNGVGVMNIMNSEFAGTGGGTGWSSNSKVLVIDGSHVQINFIGCQDESFQWFLVNNASDITGIVNLYGNLIQSHIQVNQSMTLNSVGNNFVPDAIRVAPGALPHIFSQNDVIRTDAPTMETPGVIPANPLRLVKSDDPATQFEFNPTLGAYSIKRGAFTVRQYSRFITPDYLEGVPNEPVMTIGHATTIGESKILLRLGRVSNTNTSTDEFYYDIWRANAGDDAGRLKIAGNQPNFTGLDFNGDIYATGSIRTGACQITDGPTVSADPRCSNNFYLTIGGNRTFSMPVLSAYDKTRANGQRLTIEIKQDATGSRTLNLATGAGQFLLGTDIPTVTLSTTAGKTDVLTIQYSALADRWLVIDFKKGF